MTRARRRKLRLLASIVASAAFPVQPALARETDSFLRHLRERAPRICRVPAVHAVQGPGASPAADPPPQRFDIPPGPLGGVLAALRQATGLTILVPTDAVDAIWSLGVSGVLPVARALDRALAGTSLVFRFQSPDTVVLAFRADGGSVTVSAEAPAPLVSPKFTEPLRDTPQSIDVIPAEVLADQGVATLRDAVRNVAGISLAAGEGGAQGDNLTIRGFSARSDIFIDGMRDFGSYYRDPFDQEAVQVLKGPSSVMFGRGSTGGVVNQETKSPRLAPSLSGSVTGGTDETRRVTLDVDEPVPALGSGAAVRLNVMAHDAHVAGRDVAENRRFGVAPSLSLGLGTPTRLTASYFHQSNNDTPDYGIPWLFNAPAPVARDNYYGFTDANFLRTSADIANLRVDHDVNSHLTFSNQLRVASYGRDAQISEAKLPTTVTPATPLDTIQITRNQITVSSVEAMVQEQFDATMKFDTGGVGHTVVAGLEAAHESSDPTRTTFTGVPTTSLLQPDENQPFTGTSTVTSIVKASAVSVAAYALDTVALGTRWDLTGGARLDRFDATYAQAVAPASAFERVDVKPSWRAAIVFKPSPSGSLYTSYGTSFNPSAESLSLSASTANTPPETNVTYEAGTKWDLARGALSLRGAVFRTEKTNAREPDPDNPLLNVLGGDQRVDGFELEASGHVVDRWRVLASYAYMNSRVVRSAAYPASVGAQLANVPANTLSVWNTLELPWRLEVGEGTRYVGRRTASSTAPLDPTTGLVKALPGYWLSTAMVKRRLSERASLQVNVDNVFDAYYFDQIHPAHIVPGPARSALLGLNFKF